MKNNKPWLRCSFSFWILISSTLAYSPPSKLLYNKICPSYFLIKKERKKDTLKNTNILKEKYTYIQKTQLRVLNA